MSGSNGWQSTTLGALASSKGCFIQTGPFGSQLHKRDYQKTGVGTVNPTHLENNRVNHTNVPRVSCETADRLERHRLAAGDILFARRGEIGRHGLVSEAEHGWLCGTGCFLVRIQRDDVDNRFLSYSISTPEIVDWLNRHAAGVVMPNLNNTVLHQLPIVLAPLSEQQKIAAVLGEVQRAMEQQERLIALVAELKKALLRQLFTHGLRGEMQVETEIGLMPESWTATPLGECCHVLSGSLSYTDFLNLPSAEPEDGVECMGVKVSDMNLQGNESRFVRATVQKRLPVAFAQKKLVPTDAVVFPKRGAAIATNKKRLTTTWTVLDPNLIAVRPKSSIDSHFLFYWTQTFDLKRITDPGPTPQLNKKDLTPLLIPVPPDIKEQQEIAAAISSIDAKIDLHRHRQASLSDLFRTLLHQLMTAQIRVHDLDLAELESAIAA
jgi:restriction endonuclease S subunit